MRKYIIVPVFLAVVLVMMCIVHPTGKQQFRQTNI